MSGDGPHRTSPLSRWQRNHQTQTIKENIMSIDTQNETNTVPDGPITLRPVAGRPGFFVLVGPGVSGNAIHGEDLQAVTDQLMRAEKGLLLTDGRADTPATNYTNETPLARVLDLLEAASNDHLAFATVIQERLNQVISQQDVAFSDFEQDCRQKESPLVDRLYRLHDTLSEAARVNNGTIARLTI